jgi:phosphohistidine phosphatase
LTLYDGGMTTRLIYLLRHATAQDRLLPIPDTQRALVPKGRRQVNQVVAFCQQHQLVPQQLLSSPVLRARQTADGLAKHLPGCCAVQEVDWLRTDASTERTLDGLQAALAQQHDDLWLVGHEPGLSALLAALVGAPASAFALKKASLSCLALPDGEPAQLLWSVPCSLMR